MKKVILMCFVFILATGCSNIKKMNPENIIEKYITTQVDMSNKFRTGYKYYLPRGMSIINNRNFNEVIRSQNTNYYLYVDVISYFNKVKSDYEFNPEAFFSKAIKNGDAFGYLEINTTNDKYLVEIMYNYAKIEVIVDKHDINVAIANSISVLSSIYYSDIILTNLMGENILKFNEVEFNIFETKKEAPSDYLTAIEEQGEYVEEVPDSDLIN